MDAIADLESYLPPVGAGWGGEKAPAVPVEPEAPRRSLRARTERTYVDGEDDEEDERSVSDDEPPVRPAAQLAPPAQFRPMPPQMVPQPVPLSSLPVLPVPAPQPAANGVPLAPLPGTG